MAARRPTSEGHEEPGIAPLRNPSRVRVRCDWSQRSAVGIGWRFSPCVFSNRLGQRHPHSIFLLLQEDDRVGAALALGSRMAEPHHLGACPLAGWCLQARSGLKKLDSRRCSESALGGTGPLTGDLDPGGVRQEGVGDPLRSRAAMVAEPRTSFAG